MLEEILSCARKTELLIVKAPFPFPDSQMMCDGLGQGRAGHLTRQVHREHVWIQNSNLQRQVCSRVCQWYVIRKMRNPLNSADIQERSGVRTQKGSPFGIMCIFM